MTVDTVYTPASYTGDGVTTEFALAHLVYESSHVLVTIDGVETSAWSAATYGDSNGITVTMDVAPASGVTLVIQRIVPYTQDTDLENFDGNPADVTEKQFDLLAMADQQIAEQQSRNILAPIGASLTSNEISGTIDATVRFLTITNAGPTTTTLGSISTNIDTVLTSEQVGDLLQYDGTNWVNVSEIGAAQISDEAVTNAKLAHVATNTIKGRTAAGAGDVEDLTATQARGVLDVYTKSEVDSAVATATPSGALPAAWCCLNGTGAIAIKDSYNVSGITDIATGRYRVTFDTDMENTNYAAVASCGTSTADTGDFVVIEAKATTHIDLRVEDINGNSTDMDDVNVLVFGTLAE